MSKQRPIAARSLRVAALSLLLLWSSFEPAQSTSIAEGDAVVHGITIHYLRAGAGAPVVLVHGYPENSYTWRRVIPVLARRFTVIAPDTRGTGGSSITPDFELRDAAEDIGHDFGVPIVSAYAALHRDEVRGLVVAESPLPAYGLEALYPKYWHFGFLASKFAPLLVGNNIDPFFRQFAFTDFTYNKAAFPKPQIDRYVEAEARPGRLSAGFAYYRALQKAKPFFSTAVSPVWRFPVLTLDGDHSMNGLTAASFRAIARDVTSRIVPQSGHFVQEEQPLFVTRELVKFFSAH